MPSAPQLQLADKILAMREGAVARGVNRGPHSILAGSDVALR